MLSVGDRFENPRTGASFAVLRMPEADGEALELRRVIKPGTGKTAPHVHLDFVERFVVESGGGAMKVEGRALEAAAGDDIAVPVASRHENVRNAGDDDLVVRQSFEPATAFALAFVEMVGRLMQDDRVNRQGEAPLLATFAIAHLTDAQSFAAGLPYGFQRRVVLPLGAALGRRRYELAAA